MARAVAPGTGGAPAAELETSPVRIDPRGTGLMGGVARAAERSVPGSLETPGMDRGWDAVNMDRMRRLLADEPLPDLPPEAFLARGERR